MDIPSKSQTKSRRGARRGWDKEPEGKQIEWNRSKTIQCFYCSTTIQDLRRAEFNHKFEPYREIFCNAICKTKFSLQPPGPTIREQVNSFRKYAKPYRQTTPRKSREKRPAYTKTINGSLALAFPPNFNDDFFE